MDESFCCGTGADHDTESQMAAHNHVCQPMRSAASRTVSKYLLVICLFIDRSGDSVILFLQIRFVGLRERACDGAL